MLRLRATAAPSCRRPRLSRQPSRRSITCCRQRLERSRAGLCARHQLRKMLQVLVRLLLASLQTPQSDLARALS
eukprot:5707488-Pyramimonas_sp.AAC.1